jgi:hypothetical protein
MSMGSVRPGVICPGAVVRELEERRNDLPRKLFESGRSVLPTTPGDPKAQAHPQPLERESRRSDASAGESPDTGRRTDEAASAMNGGPYEPSEGKRVIGIEPTTFSLGS